MTRLFGVGLVGLSASGGWGAEAHLPALRALRGFEVRGLAGRTVASAEATRKTYGLPYATADPADLAKRPDVDLLVIAVKVPDHSSLISAVAEAGKPIFCEWPLATDESQAAAIDSCTSHIQTFIGLQGRSSVTGRFLRELMSSDYVGEVLTTSMLGISARWGSSMPRDLTYTLELANGANLLTIPLAHALDLLEYVVGDVQDVAATAAIRVPSVQVEGTDESLVKSVEDHIAVSGRLTGGTLYSLHYSGGRIPGIGFRWEIRGTKGNILITADTGHIQRERGVVIRGARGSESYRRLDIPRGCDRLPALRDTSYHAVAQAYQQIHTDLSTGTHSAPDFRHAVRLHRLLGSVRQSAVEGSRIAVS